ncbi:MAG: FtsW/RodA/SpoVE family cell cycle protein [Fidelibacterota bacterium]
MNNLITKLKEAPLRWLFIAIVLNGFGLLALYSITTHSGDLSLSSRFFKHLFWMIPSLFAFLFFLWISKRVIHKYAYAALSVMIVLIAVPYGLDSVAGTHRWITLGGISFQPVEVLKWVLIISLARYLSDHNLEMQKFHAVVIPSFAVLLPVALIVNQPDLGSAVIVLMISFPLLYWVGARPLHLFLLLAPFVSVMTAFSLMSFSIWIAIVGVVLYLSKTDLRIAVANFFGNVFLGLLTPILWGKLHPYQQERILVMLDPTRDPYGAAYQVIQSQTAIGSGGFYGRGLGNGTQTHLKFLPEQETDFIFSVIGEELGFVVVSLILALFLYLVLDIIRAAYQSSERFSSLVIFGVAILFLFHIFVNIGMTINLLPVKGLPLPFISYGGSFLVSCYSILGLAMNMSIEGEE